MTPRFDLFEHEGRVYECGPNYPNHTEDDERLFTFSPVVVVLDCVDFGNGNGWGKHDVEQHATVLDSYQWDVGPGHVNYAVTVNVPTEAGLVALLQRHELLDRLPPGL